MSDPDGRLHARIELCHHTQKLFRAFQRIEQGQRTLAPYRQRHHRARKQNRVPHRQNGQLLWNQLLSLYSFVAPFKDYIQIGQLTQYIGRLIP